MLFAERLAVVSVPPTEKVVVVSMVTVSTVVEGMPLIQGTPRGDDFAYKS